MTMQDSQSATTASWPTNTRWQPFCQALPISNTSVYRQFFNAFADRIKVRNPELAVSKLEKILKATFKISSRKGFHAMSTRDLCQETGLSMGGMYNYFSGKEELSQMINQFVGDAFTRAGQSILPAEENLEARMETMIRCHIYMGELFQPWYYFCFMEAKSLSDTQRKAAILNEQRSVDELQSLIEIGNTSGDYQVSNGLLTASSILSLCSEWYVKHAYFRHQGVSVDEYADFVIKTANKLLHSTGS